MLASWVGGGYVIAEDDIRFYIECMRQPGHAVAGSRWYRTLPDREMLRWLRGEYDDARVEVPVRWLSGTQDPCSPLTCSTGTATASSDFQVELVDGVGHWIVEQRPELVLDRSGPSSATKIKPRQRFQRYSTPMVTSVDLMNTVAG